MKTMAIEFTLTSAALNQEGSDSLRCRVLLLNDGGVVACWRVQNVLGEDIWLGGDDLACPPAIGQVVLSRQGIIWWAMRMMAQRLGGDLGRELPNGAVVFDLGTL